MCVFPPAVCVFSLRRYVCFPSGGKGSDYTGNGAQGQCLPAGGHPLLRQRLYASDSTPATLRQRRGPPEDGGQRDRRDPGAQHTARGAQSGRTGGRLRRKMVVLKIDSGARYGRTTSLPACAPASPKTLAEPIRRAGARCRRCNPRDTPSSA